MKILFIGNANFKHAGNSHFSYNTRIHNGLVRNGHYVYYFSDRDEVTTSSPFGLKAIGIRRTNEKLLKVAAYLRPDAIIMTHVNLISPDTLRIIKDRLPEIRIGRMNVDALFNPQNRVNLKNYDGIVDATFITSGGEELGRISNSCQKFYFVPNITDSSIDIGTAFAREAPEWDLSCFMHNERGSDETYRVNLALGVQFALPDLKTCYRGFNGQPAIRANDYLNALQNSAMSLSLSRMVIDGLESTPGTRYLYSSDRIAHVMGNGSLAFISSQFGLQDLYTEDEVVFFDETKDLIERIGFYKNNPAARMRLAENGWRKAHQDFNEVTIMKYALERLFDKPLSQDYAWPTQVY